MTPLFTGKSGVCIHHPYNDYVVIIIGVHYLHDYAEKMLIGKITVDCQSVANTNRCKNSTCLQNTLEVNMF